MFPISDDNPRRSTPVVNYCLIGICVLVFLWQFSLGPEGGQQAVMSLGMIPARLFGYGELPADMIVVPAWATIFTSMFMHGGWMHLGGNMLFLWIFGDNIEDNMGPVRYLAFYLVTGVAAAMTQAFLNPDSQIPMVGASGAISGVLGAYLLLHPWATVRTVIFLGIFITMVHVPALIVLGFWFVGQLISAAMTPPGQPGVAFAAHIGGFVAGMALVAFFKQRFVPLFNKPERKGFWMEKRKGPWG